MAKPTDNAVVNEIKVDPKAIVKQATKFTKLSGADHMTKGLNDLSAADTSGAQESGVKKKRMTSVESIKYPQ